MSACFLCFGSGQPPDDSPPSVTPKKKSTPGSSISTIFNSVGLSTPNPLTEEVVKSLVPFIPNRVSSAFAGGLYTTAATGEVAFPPPPREAHAALLLVDVSGFTALSHVYSTQGSEGCEEFSLVIAHFLARMCRIIHSHGGDIDCFAGDALLVVFPAAGPRQEREPTFGSSRDFNLPGGTPTLGPLSVAVKAAVDCAINISKDLNGFQASEDHPPLGIHAALSAGPIMHVECGGKLVHRCEAFLIGEPLHELGKAMPLSGASELVMSPSAVEYCKQQMVLDEVENGGDEGGGEAEEGEERRGDYDFLEGAEEREGGCVCIRLPNNNDLNGTCHNQSFTSIHVMSLSSAGSLPSADIKGVVKRADMVIKAQHAKSTPFLWRNGLANGQRSVSRIMSSLSLRSSSEGSAHASPRGSGIKTGNKSSGGGYLSKDRKGRSQRGPLYSTIGKSPDSVNRALTATALDALLRFVPDVIKGRFAEGLQLQMLAENRKISTMFLVSDLQGTNNSKVNTVLLQNLLGMAIDVAEGDYGGCTRQITIDDKGLAAIFVFGAPGSPSQGSLTVRCLRAAMEVTRTMNSAGIKVCAGLEFGSCFCGLVGDPAQRCEYAVLGDSVNTAARLAWKGYQQGELVVCGDMFHKVWTQQCASLSFALLKGGEYRLKGRPGMAPMYTPARDVSQHHGDQTLSSTAMLSEGGRFKGREAEMAMVEELVRSRIMGPAPGEQPAPSMLLVQGLPGIGKSMFLSRAKAVIKNLTNNLPSEPTQIILVYTKGDVRPLSFCNQLLARLLGREEGRRASQFSVLEALYQSWPENQEDLPDLLKPIMSELGNMKVVERYHHGLILQHLYLRVFSEALINTPTVLMIDDADKMDAASMAVLAALGQSENLSYDLPLSSTKVKSFAKRRVTAPVAPFKIQRSSNSNSKGKGIMGPFSKSWRAQKANRSNSQEEQKSSPMPYRQSWMGGSSGLSKRKSLSRSLERRSRMSTGGSGIGKLPLPVEPHPPTPHPAAGAPKGFGRSGKDDLPPHETPHPSAASGRPRQLPSEAQEPREKLESEMLFMSDNQIDLSGPTNDNSLQPRQGVLGGSQRNRSSASEAELVWGTVHPITNAESIIIVSTCGPLQYAPMGSMPGENAMLPTLKAGPHISEVTLPPLTEDEVAGLARVMLHCTAIDQKLLDFLVSKSEGVPIVVRELCTYLLDNSQLVIDADDMASLKRQSFELSSFTFPSRDNIIRSMLDQLPARQAMILKCASILGHRFRAQMLQQLLPHDMGLVDMTSLIKLLQLLSSGDFIESVEAEHGVYKFCGMEHRQVAYSSILHRHKRALHRKAVELYKLQRKAIVSHADEVDETVRWEVEEGVATHLLVICQNAKGRTLRPNDLKHCLASVRWLIKQHERLGQSAEAFRLQKELMNCTQVSSEGRSPTAIVQQLEMALYCSQTILQALLFDKILTSEILEEMRDMLESIKLVTTELLEQYAGTVSESEAYNSADSFNASIQRSTPSSPSNMSPGTVNPEDRVIQLKAQQYMVNILDKFLPKHCIGPEIVARLKQKCFTSEDPEAQLIYAGSFAMTAQASGCFVELVEVGRAAAAVAARHNHLARLGTEETILPVMATEGILTSMFLGQAMCGEVLNLLAELPVKVLMSQAETGQRYTFLDLMAVLEGLWEPFDSPRIKVLKEAAAREVVNLDVPCEWRFRPKEVRDAIESLRQAASRITPELLTVTGEGSSSSAQAATVDVMQLQGDWAKLNAAAFDTARLAWYPYVWNIAVNCIHEGSKVLFPPTSAATVARLNSDPTDVGAVAIKHLGDAALTLSRCCRHWEETRINNDIDCSFLPGALCWAKAMLHWFEWFLWCSGHFSEDVIAEEAEAQFTASLRNINMAMFSETRLRDSLRGWDRGPVLPIGHRQLCSRLLYAQAISVCDPSKPEILAATVPATTALARMLVGQGVPQTTITAPLLVPADFIWPEPGTGRVKRSVAVKRVTIGSSQACQVASAHLKSVLSHVKVAGRTISVKAVTGVADLGGSIVLWDAVCTYRALKHLQTTFGRSGRKYNLGVGDAVGELEALPPTDLISRASMSFSMSFGRRPNPNSNSLQNPEVSWNKKIRTLSITDPAVSRSNSLLSRSSSFQLESPTDYSRRRSTGATDGVSRLRSSTSSAKSLGAMFKTVVSGLGNRRNSSSRDSITSRTPSATEGPEQRPSVGSRPEKAPSAAAPLKSMARRATVTLGMLASQKDLKPSIKTAKQGTGADLASDSGIQSKASHDNRKREVHFSGPPMDDHPADPPALQFLAKGGDPMLMGSFMVEQMTPTRSGASGSSVHSMMGGRSSMNEDRSNKGLIFYGDHDSMGSSDPDLDQRMNSMWDMHNAIVSALGPKANHDFDGPSTVMDNGETSSGTARNPTTDKKSSAQKGKQISFGLAPPGDTSSEEPSPQSSVNPQFLSTVLEGSMEDMQSLASGRLSAEVSGKSTTLALPIGKSRSSRGLDIKTLQHQLPSVPGDDDSDENGD